MTEPDPAEAADEPAGTDEEPTFENRAARRARLKGKGATTAQPHGQGHVGTGRGPAPQARQWSNRRSG